MEARGGFAKDPYTSLSKGTLIVLRVTEYVRLAARSLRDPTVFFPKAEIESVCPSPRVLCVLTIRLGYCKAI